MPIKFTCPHCGAETLVADQFAGQAGPCAKCGQMVTVPGYPLVGAGSHVAPIAQPTGGGGGKTLLVILGIVGAILLLCGGGVGVLVWYGMGATRAAAQRAGTMNSVHQIGMGIENIALTHNKFPAHASYSAEGKPLLSWRVHILPYVEGDYIYQQFHLDEPWDSPHNQQLIARMPKIYELPGQTVEAGKTCFVVPVGKKTLFPPGPFSEAGNNFGRPDNFLGPLNMGSIPDGASATIMLLTVPPEKAVIWTRPDDFDVDGGNLEDLFSGRKEIHIGAADGSARTLPATVDRVRLRQSFIIDDGETVLYEH